MYYAYSKFVSAPLVLFLYYVYLLFLLPCIVVTSIKNCDFKIFSVILLYSFSWVSSLKLHSQHLWRVKSNPIFVPLAVIQGEGSYTLGRLSIDIQLALIIQGSVSVDSTNHGLKTVFQSICRFWCPQRFLKPISHRYQGTTVVSLTASTLFWELCCPQEISYTSPPSLSSRDIHPLWQFSGPGQRQNMMDNAHGKVTNNHMFILYFIPLDWNSLW